MWGSEGDRRIEGGRRERGSGVVGRVMIPLSTTFGTEK